MSKELEALEKIKKLYKSYVEKVGLNEKDILGFDLSFACIEKELKEHDKLNGIWCTWEEPEEPGIIAPYEGIPIDINLPKKLKALEIIKKKVMPLVSLDDGEICKGHYRVYDAELYLHNELTEEEYEILKEVLS